MIKGTQVDRLRLDESQIKEIALCLNRTKSVSELSLEFGVKGSMIHYVANKLRAAGANIPKASSTLRVNFIASELRKTNPELFISNKK